MSGIDSDSTHFQPVADQQTVAQPDTQRIADDTDLDRFIFKDPVPIDQLLRKLMGTEQR